MVVWNTTEAIFNTQDGEVILHSKHPLQVKNGRKIPKVIGAVSILLIQDGEELFLSSHDINSKLNSNGGSVIDLSGETNGDLNQHEALTIPASLSFVPLPSLFGENSKANLPSGILQSLTRSSSPTETLSEKPDGQTGPPLSDQSYNRTMGDADMEHCNRSEASNMFHDNNSFSSDQKIFVENGSPSNKTFKSQTDKESYNDDQIYITVNPRSDSDSETEDSGDSSAGMEEWTESSNDIFNPPQQPPIVRAIPAFGYMDDLIPKYDSFFETDDKNRASEEKVQVVSSQSSTPKQIPTSQSCIVTETQKTVGTGQKNVLKSPLKLTLLPKRKMIGRSNSTTIKTASRCMQCKVKLNSYREITAHNENAHGKSNVCPVCCKFFTTRGSFIRHCMAHMGKRTFRCNVCLACFTRKDNLKRHFIINHKNSDWKPEYSNGFSELDEKGEEIIDTSLSSNLASNSSNSNFHTLETPLQVSTPISKTACSEKNSKLNSIVDNLHCKKAKLPLLRSILTTEKPLNTNSEHTIQEAPRHAQHPESTWKAPILNYKCSMCSIDFNSVNDLKSHIVKSHGEDKSDDQQSMVSGISENHINGWEKSCCPSNFTSIQPKESISITANESLDETYENNYVLVDDILNSSPQKDPYTCISNNSVDDMDMGVQDNASRPLLPQIKQEHEEMDIESWVKGHYDYDDIKSEPNHPIGSNTINVPVYPSPSKFSSSSHTMSQSLSNSPKQFSLPDSSPSMVSQTGNLKSREEMALNMKGKNKSNTDGKKRRLTLQNELSVCKLCGVYLQSGADIVQHGSQKHADEIDAAKCVVCLTKLSGYDSLYRHCQQHFGTLFQCAYCPSKFTRKDNLTRHIKNTHADKKSLNDTV